MQTLLLNTLLLLAPVLLGGMVVVGLEKRNRQKLIKLLLAFSGGFLLAIAFTHFLPELYTKHAADHVHSAEETLHAMLPIGIWILVGFLVQLFLEYFSGGIEHGHIHVHGHQKIPVGMLISLSVHSFIEGMPLMGIEPHHEHHAHILGNHEYSLLLGIILHQLPVAIALMTLLRVSGISSLKSWGLLFLFGIMTPLGMFTGYLLQFEAEFYYVDVLLAMVVGMFLHISTTIIFETSEQHRFNLGKLIAILLGVGLSFGLI